MISIIIPVIDQEEITEQCLINIAEHTKGPYEIILIDNGSDKKPSFKNVNIIQNNINFGLPRSLWQGLQLAKGDIIAFIHNDVLIHEYKWEEKVENAFNNFPQLAVAGFFGAMQLGHNGGRAECYSNLQGRIWGAAWSQGQSQHTEGVVPAACLDGLGMLFRTSVLKELNLKYNFLSEEYPLFHFYDRIWPSIFIQDGYHCAVIGVACDHRGGSTANTSDKYRDTSRSWLNVRGIEIVDNNVDLTTYLAAERKFFEMFQHRLPLTVDSNWNYRWTR